MGQSLVTMMYCFLIIKVMILAFNMKCTAVTFRSCKRLYDVKLNPLAGVRGGRRKIYISSSVLLSELHLGAAVTLGCHVKLKLLVTNPLPEL